jgi:HlyD family secretion protein
VQPGQPVTFSVSAFPGRTFNAKVARVDPIGQTVSNVVNYNVVSVVDKPDVELLPSMTATVTIITEQVNNVLLIPNTAVSYGSSQASRLPQVDETGDATPGGEAATGRGPGARAGAGSDGSGPGAGGNRGGARAGGEARGDAAPSTDEGSSEAGAAGRQAGGNRAGGAARANDGQTGTAGFVVVLQNGEPVARRVRLGSRDDRNTQVIAGLQLGDQIVTGATQAQNQQQAAPKPAGGSSILPTGGGGGGIPKR